MTKRDKSGWMRERRCDRTREDRKIAKGMGEQVGVREGGTLCEYL